MPAVKPESPLVVEEILLLWGYRVIYKDEFVCAMDNPSAPMSRPICIPQAIDQSGAISLEIMQQILIDTKLDMFNYFALKAKVTGLNPFHNHVTATWGD